MLRLAEPGNVPTSRAAPACGTAAAYGVAGAGVTLTRIAGATSGTVLGLTCAW